MEPPLRMLTQECTLTQSHFLLMILFNHSCPLSAAILTLRYFSILSLYMRHTYPKEGGVRLQVPGDIFELVDLYDFSVADLLFYCLCPYTSAEASFPVKRFTVLALYWLVKMV